MKETSLMSNAPVLIKPAKPSAKQTAAANLGRSAKVKEDASSSPFYQLMVKKVLTLSADLNSARNEPLFESKGIISEFITIWRN